MESAFRWVKLSRYCEMTGDTENAVYQRRYKGAWVEGVHYRLRDRKIWINLPEVQKWVEAGTTFRSPRASK